MDSDLELIGKKRLESLIDAALAKKDEEAPQKVLADIGRALISMGIEADVDVKSQFVAMPSAQFNFKVDPIGARLALSQTQAKEIPDQTSEEMGKEFWEVFKQKAMKHLCSNEGVMKLVKEGKIKEALTMALPAILAAMGLWAIWIPVIATIVAGLIVLLLQAGIDTICELYNKK